MARTTNSIFIIIGNKKDLHHLRQVTNEQGKKLAEKYCCPFYEISASEGYHETRKVFKEIIKHILYKKASEEVATLRKRNNSFTFLVKGLEKQYKLARENKERSFDQVLDISEALCA